MIKENLKLLEGTLNYTSQPQSNIDGFLIDSVDENLLKSSLRLFIDSRMAKSHYIYQIIDFYLKSDLKYVDVCKLKKYPLPAFFNTLSRKSVLNIVSLEKRSVANIEPQDLCSLFLYGHVCGVLTVKNKIPINTVDIFSEYLSMIFLKIFARKYGITGSYADLIPNLRFIVSLFICISFFDFNLNQAIKKAQLLSKFNIKSLEVDLKNYDLKDPKDFIKLLNDSQVMPGINVYEFSNRMIKQFGVINLPLFEDLMRCCSTLFASTVPGNNYFTSSFQMIHPGLYSKIITVIEKSVKV